MEQFRMAMEQPVVLAGLHAAGWAGHACQGMGVEEWGQQTGLARQAWTTTLQQDCSGEACRSWLGSLQTRTGMAYNQPAVL